MIQTRDYIKLSCETYIDRMLLTHGWSSPKAKDPDNLVPTRPEVTERLMKLEGPKEKMPEVIALSQKHGFSYQNILGELIFAYIVALILVSQHVSWLAFLIPLMMSTTKLSTVYVATYVSENPGESSISGRSR